MLSQLNSEQRAAILAPLGHNLVIASAGTGKTSTIVGRIAHLLADGLASSEILLLTFTNKAAKEMLGRLESKFGKDKTKGIEAGTFHAVAYRYLREHRQINLKQSKELKTLFKSIYDRVAFQVNSIKPYAPGYLYDLYSLFCNATVKEDFATFLERKNSDQVQFVGHYLNIFKEFSQLKSEHNYADFNDLLLLFREAVSNNNLHFVEILVDEYQDTNPLQDSIIQSLNPKSLFCVGDYDQSIYAFNGADISIIANFKERYPNGNIFSLTKNYRSTGPILSLANKVIQNNPRFFPKQLEVVKQEDFGAPKLLRYKKLFEQYQEIAKRIRASSYDWKDIAVIFRNNSSADGIEASLRELNIPSKKKGGTSFFETKEISLALNLCSLFCNPRDMMSFIHVVSYGYNIGNAFAKDLYDAFVRLGEGDIMRGILNPNTTLQPFIKPNQSLQPTLFDDLIDYSDTQRFSELKLGHFASNPILAHSKIYKESALFLGNFYELCNQLIDAKTSKIKYSNPTRVLEILYESKFLKSILNILIKERSTLKDGTHSPEKQIQAKERLLRKLSLLKDLSLQYDELERFLNAMILGGNEMNQGEGVQLLSVHASKGLEFSEVYVIDLMEGRFPNKKLMAQGGDLEEERRLFYVAVTRAKEKLFLSMAENDTYKGIKYEPSVFLYEAGLLQRKTAL